MSNLILYKWYTNVFVWIILLFNIVFFFLFFFVRKYVCTLKTFIFLSRTKEKTTKYNVCHACIFFLYIDELAGSFHQKNKKTLYSTLTLETCMHFFLLRHNNRLRSRLCKIALPGLARVCFQSNQSMDTKSFRLISFLTTCRFSSETSLELSNEKMENVLITSKCNICNPRCRLQ